MDSEKPAIVFAGLDERGAPLFDVNLSLPESVLSFSEKCTDRQSEAVRKFYGHEFEELTAFEAHRLLSYREYARQLAEYIFPDEPRTQLLFARLMAVYISSKPVLADYAAERSDERFRRAVDGSAVSRTKHFLEMRVFCEAIAEKIRIAGAVI